MQRKEEQWEGFQEFCQSSSHQDNNNQPSEKPQQPQIIPTEHDKNEENKETEDVKQIMPTNKKMKVKPRMPEQLKKQQQHPKQQNMETTKLSTHNDHESPSKLTVRQSKYQRIPIMRKEDDFRYTGSVVYRSFAPRSSDTYFRTLKTVDFQAPATQHKFKANEMYEFNKFKVEIQDRSFKVGESQFDLYMKVDTNTNGHRQWFYFSVRNLLPGTVKFNIYRFKKKFSLFQRGMKPYVRSKKEGKGWHPSSGKIAYRTEKYSGQPKNQNQSPSYYLTFQYKFEYAEDEVYFSAGIPYPISYLNKRLFQLLSLPNPQIQVSLQNMGKTLGGQDFQLLTVCAKSNSQNQNYIIINARTHPGQTSSSWVLDGLLQRLLTDETIKAWIVENNIHLKIIPVLNSDGVFVGNYRTGIIGEDFNRKFASGKKQLFPQIHFLKKVVSDCKRSGKVLLFLDLHGHSVLKNSFIYGPSQNLFTSNPLRSLPFTLWHHSKYFRLSSCKFKFDKDMSQTARIYFQIKQNILSYTCQISLGLYYQGSHTFQMLETDYKSLGQSIICSISELVTKQKLINFHTCQQSIPAIQKTLQSIQKPNSSHSKAATEIYNKEVQTKTSTRKQYKRQTCIEKIKNIKQQLIEQQSTIKREYGSVDEKSLKKTTNKYLNKSKLDLNQTSLQGASQKLHMLKTANKISIVPRRNSIIDPFSNEHTKILDDSPVRADKLQMNKASREAQFKIRRKSDMLRILPQSLRKKLGPKIQLSFTSTKNIKNDQNEDEQYILQRSATYDTPYLSTQIQAIQQANEQMEYNLQIINQRFSEQYKSINDSDNSSQDLNDKQKQYLIECIKNNKKMKTSNEEGQQQGEEQEEETEEGTSGASVMMNINGFKEIRFKSIEAVATRTMLPFRNTKRDAHKFRQYTHNTYKSLNRNFFEQQSALIPQMVQKKQLNQRINKKNIRQPYFLVQIRNKHH